MDPQKAQRIVESIADGERNYVYGDWDRAEAICTVLRDLQEKLTVVAIEAKKLLKDP